MKKSKMRASERSEMYAVGKTVGVAQNALVHAKSVADGGARSDLRRATRDAINEAVAAANKAQRAINLELAANEAESATP